MSKFGIGIGEEFPVDEQNQPDVPEDGEGPHRCRHGRHGHHKAWRHFRQRMKAEWHGRHRGWHGHRGDGAEVLDAIRAHHVHKLVIGGLALIGVAALIGVLNSRR